jgi:hypothetical protein
LSQDVDIESDRAPHRDVETKYYAARVVVMTKTAAAEVVAPGMAPIIIARDAAMGIAKGAKTGK